MLQVFPSFGYQLFAFSILNEKTTASKFNYSITSHFRIGVCCTPAVSCDLARMVVNCGIFYLLLEGKTN